MSTLIDATPAEIWDAIDDIRTHTEWMHDAESIEFLTQRTRGVDTTFLCVTRIGPFRTRDVLTVTEWSPGRAMGIAHKGAVQGSGRFTITERRGGQSKFMWREQLRFPWWMGGPVGAFLAWPILRRVWQQNLGRLKSIIEAPADGADSTGTGAQDPS